MIELLEFARPGLVQQGQFVQALDGLLQIGASHVHVCLPVLQSSQHGPCHLKRVFALRTRDRPGQFLQFGDVMRQVAVPGIRDATVANVGTSRREAPALLQDELLMPTQQITHDVGRHVFESVVDGETAQLEYNEHDGVLTILHTRVPAPVSGRGLGGRLVDAALAYAESQGLRVASECGFASRHIASRPGTPQLDPGT